MADIYDEVVECLAQTQSLLGLHLNCGKWQLFNVIVELRVINKLVEDISECFWAIVFNMRHVLQYDANWSIICFGKMKWSNSTSIFFCNYFIIAILIFLERQEIIIMQLFEEDWIKFIQIWQNLFKLFVVEGYKVIASKKCFSIHNEVVLFPVKFILCAFADLLRSISDNECHETERESNILVEQYPVIIFPIYSMPIAQWKISQGIFFGVM